MRRWGLLAVLVAALAAVAVWVGCDATRSESPRDASSPGDANTAPVIDRTSGADDASAARAGRPGRHPKNPESSPVCALTVRVETTEGVPVEAALVSNDDVSAYTDRAGRALLGDVPRGQRCTVTVEFQSHKDEEYTRDVDVPADAAEYELVVRVDPPLWPVLVIRILSDVPREAGTDVTCGGGADYSFGNLSRDTAAVRVPVPPPRTEKIQVRVRCPGFVPVETDVDAPRTPGEHALELRLHSGGLPAWGRVLEADGTPAEGATVIACRGSVRTSFFNPVKTGPDGRFLVTNEMRDVAIVALRAGKECSGLLRMTEDSATVELRLGPGAAAEGDVTDDAGSPVDGAEVSTWFSPSSPEVAGWSAVTDARGHYRIAGIPEGWWFRPGLGWRNNLGPGDEASGPFARGNSNELVARGEAHVAGPPGDVFRRDLRAKRFTAALECQFELRFPAGAEVPWTVDLESWTDTGSSRSDCKIDQKAPVVSCTVEPGKRTIFRVSAGSLEADTGWFVVEAGGTGRSFVLDMRSPPRLIAQLVGDAGAPVRRAGVKILVGHWRGTSGSGTQSAMTDDAGRADVTSCVPSVAVLDDPARAVSFAMSGPGVLQRFELGEHPNLRIAGPDLAQRLRTAADEAVLPIPVIPPRRVVVRTVDESGRAVGGVTLELGEGIDEESVTTGPDGLADASLVRDFEVQLECNVTATAKPPFVGEASRKLREFEGHLDEPWTIPVVQLVRQRVRIVDEDGAPVAGVELNSDRECLTDARGEADIYLHAPQGDWVQIAGFAPSLVVPASDGSTARVQVAAVRTVELLLTVPQDAPKKFTETVTRTGAGIVEIGAITVNRRPEFTDHVSITRAAHTVELLSEDGLWQATVHIPAGALSASATVERRQLRSVRVQFVDADGAALANTRVAIALTGPPSFASREESTDGAGEVRLELPDGEYGLCHALPGATLSEPQPFTVPADAPIVVRM